MSSDRHTYEYDIDLESDVAPARVLRMVKKGSKVLEIGAGPGSITRHLSGTLGCDVVALEIDPTAIEKLKPFARSVYAADLNDPAWADQVRAKDGVFDYVIAADVLEHVYDPWKVLGGMKSLLNEQGSVILSLPHAGHAAVLGCLVDEDFEYRDWGLLDRTHVRFFGVKNVQALYASQGMAIEEAEFVVRTPEMTEFVHRWNRLPSDVRVSLQRNRYSHVYQVVSRAVPEERARNNIYLLGQDVPAPTVEAVNYWESVYARIKPEPHVDQRTTIGAVDGAKALSVRNCNGWEDKDVGEGGSGPNTADTGNVRLIAFYLTQFHPFPENDSWWGKGFTEWTNVTKAQPQFPGHHQPQLPTDLGFYDLRVRETRREQIALAKSYGIDGFCYYYYWFSGHRLLEKPLEDMLSDPQSDMPFCLCWANENWTRRWDGAENEILIAQQYRPEDDVEFIRSLEPYLRDKRYIRVDGKPLIIVYRPQAMPDAARSVQIWRDYCRDAGIGEIHAACALTHGNWDHRPYGFDSGVEFPPHSVNAKNLAPGMEFHSEFSGYCPDYHQIAEMYLQNSYGPDRSGFRGVLPSWDNTARRGKNGTVVLNGTPENYEHWLSRAVSQTRQDFPGEERLVFINAWNEWAEGCHLEPDRKFGHSFLEATARAKSGNVVGTWVNVGVPQEAIAKGWRRKYKAARAPGKSRLSHAFRLLRDTLNGRAFR